MRTHGRGLVVTPGAPEREPNVPTTEAGTVVLRTGGAWDALTKPPWEGIPASIKMKSRGDARKLRANRPTSSGWGGKRLGAGRKRAPGRLPSVPHVARPAHEGPHPVHVLLRAQPGAVGPGLRSERLFPLVRRILLASQREDFRIVHYSVRPEHMHLLVEAADEERLSRGISGFSIRVARLVNREVGRKGGFWADRYQLRPLTSPRAVRSALVEVLSNFRERPGAPARMDPCSSAACLDGWAPGVVHPSPDPEPLPVVPASTWLLRVGWRRGGLLRLDEAAAAPTP